MSGGPQQHLAQLQRFEDIYYTHNPALRFENFQSALLFGKQAAKRFGFQIRVKTTGYNHKDGIIHKYICCRRQGEATKPSPSSAPAGDSTPPVTSTTNPSTTPATTTTTTRSKRGTQGSVRCGCRWGSKIIGMSRNAAVRKGREVHDSDPDLVWFWEAPDQANAHNHQLDDVNEFMFVQLADAAPHHLMMGLGYNPQPPHPMMMAGRPRMPPPGMMPPPMGASPQMMRKPGDPMPPPPSMMPPGSYPPYPAGFPLPPPPMQQQQQQQSPLPTRTDSDSSAVTTSPANAPLPSPAGAYPTPPHPGAMAAPWGYPRMPPGPWGAPPPPGYPHMPAAGGPYRNHPGPGASGKPPAGSPYASPSYRAAPAPGRPVVQAPGMQPNMQQQQQAPGPYPYPYPIPPYPNAQNPQYPGMPQPNPNSTIEESSKPEEAGDGKSSASQEVREGEAAEEGEKQEGTPAEVTSQEPAAPNNLNSLSDIAVSVLAKENQEQQQPSGQAVPSPEQQEQHAAQYSLMQQQQPMYGGYPGGMPAYYPYAPYPHQYPYAHMYYPPQPYQQQQQQPPLPHPTLQVEQAPTENGGAQGSNNEEPAASVHLSHDIDEHQNTEEDTPAEDGASAGGQTSDASIAVEVEESGEVVVNRDDPSLTQKSMSMSSMLPVSESEPSLVDMDPVAAYLESEDHQQ